MWWFFRSGKGRIPVVSDSGSLRRGLLSLFDTGQLISECPFDVLNFPKKQWKNLKKGLIIVGPGLIALAPFWVPDDICLVLLCDQNSFRWSKTVLVWPNLFGLDHNDLVKTKMKWSRPKWISQVQIVINFGRKSQVGPDQFILVGTISFWLGPFHFGHDQIIMVKSKSIWSDQNNFGLTKTVLVT